MVIIVSHGTDSKLEAWALFCGQKNFFWYKRPAAEAKEYLGEPEKVDDNVAAIQAR